MPQAELFGGDEDGDMDGPPAGKGAKGGKGAKKGGLPTATVTAAKTCNALVTAI